MTAPSASPSPVDRLPPGAWKIAAVASFGAFLAQLDATMVNVALPSLVDELNRPINVMQWVVAGYLLALTLVLPLSGYLVGRIGAKAVYLISFTGFALTSALCGLAWSASSLIAFRFLQGMSGGLLAPMAHMMIARAAGNQTAKVAGYAAIPILLGPILGPVIAGNLLQHLSWRWLFYISSAVALVAIALALAFIPRDQREDLPARPMDWAGLAMLSPGLVLLLYSLTQSSAMTGLAMLSVALVLLTLFVARARKAGSLALIDVRLLGYRPFRVSVIVQFLSNGINFTTQMLLPMFLVIGCQRPAGEIGWLMAPLGMGMLFAYPLMGGVIRRLGARNVALTGSIVSLGSMGALAAMSGIGFLPTLLLPALFLFGVGQGAVGLSSVTTAYTAFPSRDLPMAMTSMSICQRLGGPILTTTFALFLGWRLARDGAGPAPFGAFPTTFALLCLVLALSAVAASWFPRASEAR